MPAPTLRRYTTLPALIALLQRRAITLLDPASWEDRNDAHYLRLYKQKLGLKSVLALCFTQAEETYHHWRVFAEGSSGICIRFRRAGLLRALKGVEGLSSGSVSYRTLGTAKRNLPTPAQLPFLKRIAFKDEKEFRLVYGGAASRAPTLDVPIPLTTIDRIILNPWIHPSISDNVKKALKGIDGCGRLTIVRSTLISNTRWKELGDQAR